MSMSGTMGTLRSPDRRSCRDLASDPPPINPVIPAAGLSSTVTVGLIYYVARWAGHDTEKCIEKALEDGVLKLDYKSDWRRDHDVYCLTPKGPKQSGKHMRDVFERSARMARLDYEEDVRKGTRAAGDAAAGPGRPPPLSAGELIPPICQFKGNCRRGPFCLVVGDAAEPASPRACTGPPARHGLRAPAAPACRTRLPPLPCASRRRRGGLSVHRHAKAARRRILTRRGGAPNAGRPAGVCHRRGPVGCAGFYAHAKPRLRRRRDGLAHSGQGDCRRRRLRLRQHGARWGRG